MTAPLISAVAEVVAGWEEVEAIANEAVQKTSEYSLVFGCPSLECEKTRILPLNLLDLVLSLQYETLFSL